MADVLDSVLGVSKVFFDIAEVWVVMRRRRHNFQQPRLHISWKAREEELVISIREKSMTLSLSNRIQSMLELPETTPVIFKN